MEEQVDTLEKFGKEFQSKVISAFLEDRSFLEKVNDIVDPNFWQSESHQWIVEKTLNYYSQYKNSPTLDYFKVESKEIQTDSFKTAVVSSLKKAFLGTKALDLEYHKDEFGKFCINQRYKIAVVRMWDYVQKGDYDKIKAEIKDAATAEMDRDLGHDYLEDFKTRMTRIKRNPIATGFDVIDNITGGGTGAGDLGVVVANAGAGKSWVLAKIGSHAISLGNNVLHISLELDDTYVGYRYDSIFSGHEVQTVIDNEEEVWKSIQGLKGSLKIKQYPSRRASADTIMSHVQRCIALGFRPDMIIVDYADILRPTENLYSRDDLVFTGIYEDLRGLGGEIGCPIWTASQSNRGAVKTDIIEADGVSDSYGKVATGDFIMSLSRRTVDKANNVGRFHVMKNRYGPDGMTFPAKINTSTGDIRMFEDNTKDGIEITNMVEGAEKMIKKGLKDKYKNSLKGGKKLDF
jgi:hypothetical protein